MMRQKKKTLEDIYAPKLLVNHNKQKSQPRETVKIERKCEKTGVLITLSGPSTETDRKQFTTRGAGGGTTYRVPTSNYSKFNNNINNIGNIGNINRNRNLNTANHISLRNPKPSVVENEIESEEGGDDFETARKSRVRTKPSRAARRKTNLKKLFECICNENGTVNVDMPMEPPMQMQNPNSAHPRQHFVSPERLNNYNCATPKAENSMDPDSEEFFTFVRNAVEAGVQKVVKEEIEKHYEMFAEKMDTFTNEIKKFNLLLRKTQEDLEKKIVHYGEETSRHFRYLCMKSEYDKLFYQHNTLIALNNLPSSGATNVETQKSSPEPCNSVPSAAADVPRNSTATPNATNDGGKPSQNTEPNSKTSNDSSSNLKESKLELNIQDIEIKLDILSHTPDVTKSPNEQNLPTFNVLSRIEKLCKRLKEENEKEVCVRPESGTYYNSDEVMIINKEVYDEEDLDSFVSSEALTPTSTGNMAKYEGQALRAATGYLQFDSTGGAGDAQ